MARSFTLSALLGAILLAGASTESEAQNNCRKGIPCGNTCISASKVCRIDGGSIAREIPPENQAPRLAAIGSPRRDSVTQSGNPVSEEIAWVGSSRGSTYYRAGCAGARRLSVSNLIGFRSEAEARASGYRRSSQRGC